MAVSAPLRYCSYPRCPNKTPHTRCAQHQQQQRQVEKRFQQGATSYGRPWRRLRDQHIAEYPFCVECEQAGKTTLAEEVDHIEPHKGNRDKMYDPNNLQSLCKSHHSAKTQREVNAGTADVHAYRTASPTVTMQGTSTTTNAQRYVVTGPPGSGKTTWVEQRRQPGDLVWDLDAIAHTISGLSTFPRPGYLLETLSLMRDGFILSLQRRPQARAFIIDSNRDNAEQTAQRINAELIDIAALNQRSGDVQ